MRMPSRSRWLAGVALLAGGLGSAAGCVADPAEIVIQRQQLELYATNAQMYLEAGDLGRARQQALKALDVDDEYHKAQLILGNVLFLAAQRTADADERREFLNDAEGYLLQVAQDAPRSDVAVFKAYYVLGDLYHFRHVTTLQESVRLEKSGAPQSDWGPYADEADAMLDLAVRYYQNALLTSQQRFDAARARLVETLFYRGRDNPTGPDYDSALEQAEQYIDKATTDQQVFRERLQEIPRQPDLSDQQRTLALQRTEARIKELHFNVVRMREQRARLLARRKDWDGAAAELERAIAEEPTYSLLYHAHALALAQSGALARAHTQLARFGEMREAARQALATERERVVNSATANADQIRAIDTRIADCFQDRFRVTLALALLDCRLGRYPDARARLDALLMDDPQSVATTVLALANALELGERARAGVLVRLLLKRLREDHPDLREVVELAAAIERSVTGG